MCSNLMVKKTLVGVKNNILTFLISLVEDKKNFDWTNCFNQFVLCISCKPNCKIYRHVSFAFRERNRTLTLYSTSSTMAQILSFISQVISSSCRSVKSNLLIQYQRVNQLREWRIRPILLLWYDGRPLLSREGKKELERRSRQKEGRWSLERTSSLCYECSVLFMCNELKIKYIEKPLSF